MAMERVPSTVRERESPHTSLPPPNHLNEATIFPILRISVKSPPSSTLMLYPRPIDESAYANMEATDHWASTFALAPLLDKPHMDR